MAISAPEQLTGIIVDFTKGTNSKPGKITVKSEGKNHTFSWPECIELSGKAIRKGETITLSWTSYLTGATVGSNPKKSK